MTCVVIESFGVGDFRTALLRKVYEGMKEVEKRRKLIVMTTQVVSEEAI